MSLARQVAGLLRAGITTGQLKAGVQVPSSRSLAVELGVSRNTVLEAYSQLLAEGHFEARTGSGTFVATSLLPELAAASAPQPDHADLGEPLSATGAAIVAAYQSVSGDEVRAFNPGIPALEPELFKTWWRVASRVREHIAPESLNYGDARGLAVLREHIAAYVGPSRGVRCSPDQVVVTTGTQHALALSARLLLQPGDQVLVEDPGYSGAKGALAAAGATLVGMPVTPDGWDVDRALGRASTARLAYVSPSHQYPLGVTMALPARLALLEWARAADAWILEDDYDAEFRHSGRALPSLQGLDRSERVLYIGTFSKALFPSLRLGYAIVPRRLVDAYAKATAVTGRRVPTFEQAVLAEFIASGHFSRHVRRLRQRYERSRRALETALAARFGNSITLFGAPIGMHVVGRYRADASDVELSRRAEAVGVFVPPLSRYYLEHAGMNGLVFGYGHLGHDEILRGVDALATVWPCRSGPPVRPLRAAGR